MRGALQSEGFGDDVSMVCAHRSRSFDAEGASQTRDRDLGEARRLTAGSGHYLLVPPDPRDTLKGITRPYAAECTTWTHVMRCLHL